MSVTLGTKVSLSGVYESLNGCRVCGGELVKVLSLGNLCISGFPKPDEPDLPRAPLTLARCWTCGLVQLADTIDPSLLFGAEYWYRSGINETMVAELQDVVRMALDGWIGAPLAGGEVVVDIGANDGTLLAAYPESVIRVAYEPSTRWHEYLEKACDVLVPHPFPPQATHGYAVKSGSARVVTSIACFYDLQDPRSFVREVKRILHPNGVWILQFQDLDQMLRATAFDNICHEHAVYYSLRAIIALVEEEGLQVSYATRRAINGGSLRVVVQHAERMRASRAIEELLEAEKGCESWARLEDFAARTTERIAQIYAVLQIGKTVDLYAASTKANTWLQAAGLSAWHIRQAWERTPEKIGRVTVGTRIPIVSEEVGRANPPEMLVIGAWQFRDAFLKREAEYLTAGGTIIFPLPEVEIVQERWATAEKLEKKERSA